MPLMWIAGIGQAFCKTPLLNWDFVLRKFKLMPLVGSRYCLGVSQNASTRSGFRALCRQVVGALTIRSHRQTMLGLVAER